MQTLTCITNGYVLGGPAVKNLPSNAGYSPSWGNNITRDTGQLNQLVTNREPVSRNYQVHALYSPCSATRARAATREATYCNEDPAQAKKDG